MRIWHEVLIPYLCNKHLGALWNEGLTLYDIITQGKKGWKNTPMRKEYEDCPERLWKLLWLVKKERKKRGLKCKEMPELYIYGGVRKPYQDTKKQVLLLIQKREEIESCDCDTEAMLELIARHLLSGRTE